MIGRGHAALGVVAALAGCDRLFPIEAPSYDELILADHPVAYWRLDDSGLTAVDLAGDGDGTYRGNVLHGDGAVAGDTAAILDGTSGFIDAGNRLGFEGAAMFSVEAWVNPRASSSYQGVVCKDDEPDGAIMHHGYTLFCSDVAVGFERADFPTTQDVRTAQPIALDRWTHVVATYDGNLLSLYVDGGLVTSTPTPPLLMIPTTTRPFVIGARRGGDYLFFDGSIDEVAVYDYPLSEPQIRGHHGAGKAQ